MVEQCESMEPVEKKLKEMEIDYVRATVEEGRIQVDQLFFHDPDDFMIEICNCDSLSRWGGKIMFSCESWEDAESAADTENAPTTLMSFVLCGEDLESILMITRTYYIFFFNVVEL